MKKYRVVISESKSGAFTIEAKDEDEAYEIAKDKYYNGMLDLCGVLASDIDVEVQGEVKEGEEW